jgi:hypothetical protein
MALFANIYFNVPYIHSMVHVLSGVFIIKGLGIQPHVVLNISTLDWHMIMTNLSNCCSASSTTNPSLRRLSQIPSCHGLVITSLFKQNHFLLSLSRLPIWPLPFVYSHSHSFHNGHHPSTAPFHPPYDPSRR